MRGRLVMQSLTHRQKEILDFITHGKEERGIPPTVREIAAYFRISIGPAQRHIKALVRKGVLRHTPLVSRGLDLPVRRPHLLVPVLGKVTAGIPVPPVEEAEESISIDRDYGGRGDLFALRVKGDSMTGSGIFEGDIVVVRRQPDAEHNEIVVAMVEGEAAVKKLVKQGRDTHLESTNPKYAPIRAREIEIVGKVISLIRNYIK